MKPQQNSLDMILFYKNVLDFAIILILTITLDI